MSEGKPAAGFNDWPLHDAVVRSIRLDWEAGRVTLDAEVFFTHEEHAKAASIEWSGVRELHVPRRQPWGPSYMINGQRTAGGAFIFEMQSGDEVRVVADSVELVVPLAD